jgi:hypothetical protein
MTDDGSFTISRADFYAKVRSGQLGIDNEHLDASVGDPNDFRFYWRWSWRRFHWVPFELEAT